MTALYFMLPGSSMRDFWHFRTIFPMCCARDMDRIAFDVSLMWWLSVAGGCGKPVLTSLLTLSSKVDTTGTGSMSRATNL